MLTIAYLANEFPSAVEPYVSEEIEELRARGIRVVAGTVRRTADNGGQPPACAAEITLRPVSWTVLVKAAWLCLRRLPRLSVLLSRIFLSGREGPVRRAKALLHTWLGACYAVRLQEWGVDHIHVHHGFFGSWIAMTAARLLGVNFSLTLHGSDALLHRNYLDLKLRCCAFCLTVSEYNRLYLLENYPEVPVGKILLSHLGVDVPGRMGAPGRGVRPAEFALLAVGRLHAVKDHAFLIRACAALRGCGVPFECTIAGEGPERRRLQRLIRKLGVEAHVFLPGHIPRRQMDSLYDRADVVVLTSRSEGLPLVLMEAMARAKIVIAPSITGIPELVRPGRTGFLYEPGSLQSLLARLLYVRSQMDAPDVSNRACLLSASRQLDWMRHAARVQVRQNFHRSTNLKTFADRFIPRIVPQTVSPHEDPLLQQVQLSLQRNRSLPLRTNGLDALAGPPGGAVFHD